MIHTVLILTVYNTELHTTPRERILHDRLIKPSILEPLYAILNLGRSKAARPS